MAHSTQANEHRCTSKDMPLTACSPFTGTTRTDVTWIASHSSDKLPAIRLWVRVSRSKMPFLTIHSSLVHSSCTHFGVRSPFVGHPLNSIHNFMYRLGLISLLSQRFLEWTTEWSAIFAWTHPTNCVIYLFPTRCVSFHMVLRLA